MGRPGLSTDFDHPTLTGYDSDHELAEGEVGRLGVAIDTAADMGKLFDGIPLAQASVSLTHQPPGHRAAGDVPAHRRTARHAVAVAARQRCRTTR